MNEQQFFDLNFQNAAIEVMPKGSVFYHGFQGDEPIMNDHQALWVSVRKAEAEEYSHFSNRTRKGGVLKLELRTENTVVLGKPNGHQFLASIDSSDHRLFAMHLHAWATRSRTRFVRESQDCYIAFRARTDFDVLYVHKWSKQDVN